LTLLRGEARIAGLCHGRAENVEDAGVLPLARQAAEFLVHTCGVLPRKVRDAADAQHLKITRNLGPYRYQVAKTSFFSKHANFSLTLPAY
jgi:hypothetical protein